MSEEKNKTRITLDILLYFLSFTMCCLMIFLAVYYYILEVEKVAKQTYQNTHKLNEQVRIVKELTDNQYYDISGWLINKNNETAIQNVIFRYQYRWPTQKKKLQFLLKNQTQDSLTFAVYNIITNIDTLFEQQRKQLWEPEIIESYNTDNKNEDYNKRTFKEVQNILHFHEQSNRKVAQNLNLLTEQISNKSQLGIQYFYSTINIQKTTVIVGTVILLVVFLLFINYYYKSIYQSLNVFFKLFYDLVDGEKISEHLTDLSSSGKIKSISPIFKNISLLSQRLNTIESSLVQLSEKNININDKDLKNNDPIKKALIKLKSSIQITSFADTKREWEKSKIKIFEEITQQEDHTIQTLCNLLIKEVCVTLDGHTGNIFVIDDDDNIPIMRLRASYAYDRLKKRDATYYENDGLIGQIWKDPEVYIVSNLSEDYLDIRSSLGEAYPSNVIIIPIIGQHKVFSIIEIASLKNYDNQKIEFIKSISNMLGTTFSNLIYKEKYEEQEKNNTSLSKVNYEYKEELASTQKSMESIKAEYNILKLTRNTILESVNKVFIRVEYDEEGIVSGYNDFFIEVFGYKKSDMRGQHHATLVSKEYRNSDEYLDFWKRIKSGNVIRKKEKWQTKDGKDFSTNVYYSPILDSKSNFEGVVVFIEYHGKKTK